MCVMHLIHEFHRMAGDTVANIRFNVAKSFHVLLPIVEASVGMYYSSVFSFFSFFFFLGGRGRGVFLSRAAPNSKIRKHGCLFDTPPPPFFLNYWSKDTCTRLSTNRRWDILVLYHDWKRRQLSCVESANLICLPTHMNMSLGKPTAFVLFPDWNCCSVVQQQIKPVLSRMTDDSDRDVKYFASQALQQC